MAGSFGARLRQRREEQGIALVPSADETKIKLSLLEGLERDDVTHWPLGIFRRAYVRAYAQAIGLSPNIVLREFLELYPESPEVLSEAFGIPPAGDAARPAAGPPTRFRYILDSALGSLARRQAPQRGSRTGDPGRRDFPAEVPVLPDPAWIDDSAGIVVRAAPAWSSDTGSDPPRAVADASAPIAAAGSALDFLAVARLCTELARAAHADDLEAVLPEIAAILDASGAIVWIWDRAAEVLRPALAHGYSDQVLAQLPAVRRDADNATAAAFRSAQACEIDGTDEVSGALVVPLLTSAGCGGVLALELRLGAGRRKSVRAAATIFAAMLAQLIGGRRDEA